MQLPKAQKSKAQKIDRSQVYPCTCPKRAKLKPITLTDAFGCDRCPLIFAVEEDGCTLVRLGGIDPYRRAWYWNGVRWQPVRNVDLKYARELLPIQLVMVSSVVLMFLLLVALNSNQDTRGLLLAIVVTISIILIVCWLLLLRRREP